MSVTVRNVRPEGRVGWFRMRRALWDDCPDEQQQREIDEILGSDMEEVFFAERPR
jgi:aminoglycoside 6'-N-acetyltransferase I